MFDGFTPALGHAFEAAAGRDQKLYGYAEHDLSCVFLGTSSGLRLRHDQPSGKVELNAKSADLARSAWAGGGQPRLHRRGRGGAWTPAWRGGSSGPARRVELPAGRYETLLPPGAMADLLTYMYWSAGAKDALDGRTVFSKPGGGDPGGRAAGQPAA